MQQEQQGQSEPSVSQDIQPSVQPPAEQPPVQTEVREIKKGGSKKTLFIVAIVIAALLLAAGGAAAYYFLVVKRSESEQEQEGEDDDVDEVEEGEHGEAEEVEEEEQEEEEETDPYAGWAAYTNKTVGVSFKYPAGWTLDDDCLGESGDCGISLSNGNYDWTLLVDPFTTGGGYGFLIADLPSDPPSVYTSVTPGGYNVVMLNGYRSSAWIAQQLGGEFTVPDGDLWINSTTFRDQEDLINTLGFGPGAMYDSTLGNFFAIKYEYDIQGDYANLRVKGSTELVQKLRVMDLMTNSIELS